MMDTLTLVAAAAPLLAGLDMLMRPVERAAPRLRLPEIAALAALAVGLVAAGGLVLQGPTAVAIAGTVLLIDIVSVGLMLTVALIGWAVLRFSRVALDGEARQGAFMGWMSLVLAAVMVLVTAGTLAQLVIGWAGVALALRPLILFYAGRPLARRAARLKAACDIVGHLALIAAAVLMANAFGTGEIAAITEAVAAGARPEGLWLVAVLLAVAAVAASALIPVQGWLHGVIEAPTPVSALLHAGVVAAGGFLVIRFAEVFVAVPGVMAGLALLGGFSALAGAAIALTQPAVKTSLAWSTSAQMGFMMLQCGLGLFPLALLHIIAHALYKAHAFLGSGGAVEAVAAIRRPGPVAVPGIGPVGRAFALSLTLFFAVGFVFGLGEKAPQAVALGAILVFGVAYLVAQGMADAAPRELTRRTAIMAVLATGAYFALQSGAEWVAAGTLPPPPVPDGLAWIVMVLTVGSFGVAALAQATLPLWATHPAAAALRVHLMNGLYLDTVADRLAGRFTARKETRA
ncbi:MAG: proton-conducting transporter membrane subunit [Pseudomonadota bacterium]